MPSMLEIYQRHAREYHELVSAEDYRGNLWSSLRQICRWDGDSVIEAGVGTGRVTKLYVDSVRRAVCTDRSENMIEFARRVLERHLDIVEFQTADNLSLPILADTFDIFIEGWSFGHSVADAPDPNALRSVAAGLVRNATKNVRNGGTVILIETLGSNADEPEPPIENLARFYELLEIDHGFRRREVRTDYQFVSMEEAIRVMGFFFGEEMGESVRRRAQTVIPEWTGIWYRQQ